MLQKHRGKSSEQSVGEHGVGQVPQGMPPRGYLRQKVYLESKTWNFQNPWKGEGASCQIRTEWRKATYSLAKNRGGGKDVGTICPGNSPVGLPFLPWAKISQCKASQE
jgi:hypothetical protein